LTHGNNAPKQNPTRKNGSTKTDQHRKEGVHHSGKGDAEKIRGEKLKSSAGSRQGNKAHQGGEREREGLEMAARAAAAKRDGSPRRRSKRMRNLSRRGRQRRRSCKR